MKYIFELKLKDLPNTVYQHTVELSGFQESYPEHYFTQTVCEEIRINLQQQSNCLINDLTLKKLINTWKEDIKEGYRETTMTFDLPNIFESKCEQLIEEGYKKIPDLLEPDLSGIEPQIGCLPPLNFV